MSSVAVLVISFYIGFVYGLVEPIYLELEDSLPWAPELPPGQEATVETVA